MLPKALLAIRRYRGRVRPRYADPEGGGDPALAEVLIRLYREHLGRRRGELEEALTSLETHRNFKLVRGLAELLNRRCEFSAPEPAGGEGGSITPQELRDRLFHRGYVTSQGEREAIIEEAAREVGLTPEEIESLFWADLEEEQLLQRFDPPSPGELLKQYNLSLTQTLLFDALRLEFTVRGNFKGIFRQIKRLGLMYELRASDPDEGRVRVEVSGPASLLSQTTRYGPAFAELLPVIIEAEEWALRAEIRTPTPAGKIGPLPKKSTPRTYEFSLDSSRRDLLGVEPSSVSEPERFDSAVEEDFAGRIRHIMPEWEVRREPVVLKAGRHAFIPDFGFFLRRPGRREPVARLYLEIVGFWTEDYLRRKVIKLREVAPEVPLMIAVDKGLSCSAEEFQPKLESFASPAEVREVIFYEGTLPLEPVISRLQQLAEEQTKGELGRLRAKGLSLPDKKVIPLKELAEEQGVGPEVIRRIIEEGLATGTDRFRLIGEKLVAREALEELRAEIEALPLLDDGKSRDYFKVKGLLEGFDLPESALRELGFKVEWRRLLPPDARVIEAK